ncbi:MAG TPA: acetate/propionate family kinase, partial [Cytophagaceae bacterium]|nr:acetate/propionate family kinase [Cytophagaceae bacterium]
MNLESKYILTINGGSSSIRFAFYKIGEALYKEGFGKIERIGLKDTQLQFHFADSNEETRKITSNDYNSVVLFLLAFLKEQETFRKVVAIGHRIVYGMNHTSPELITNKLLEDLYKAIPYDPEHAPGELKLIESFRQKYPTLPQVACFDTAFHQTMPEIAKMLPIPRRLYKKGIQRYGFHGLSYTYLSEELMRISNNESVHEKLIFAHLGNGASLAAIKNGKSIDTSMGFTPAGGIPMSCRSGDIDPGLFWYLIQQENFTPEIFNQMIHHQSGLLGISETSSDMRDLLTIESKDGRAADAINLFCYQVKKNIGAYTAALGGLDTLVFTGGIGENAPEIRKRICAGMEFLG